MKKHDLSPDTEVVLLLCGRFGGERQEPYAPLSPSEYSELAKLLIAHGGNPSKLLTAALSTVLPNLGETRLTRERVEFLLGRGTAMALALERWARGGIWVISRADAEYPSRVKRQLKHNAPPLLYGAGETALLENGGLAIVGSRDITPEAFSFTEAIAARCARERWTVVSGGARGADAAAMQGVTAAGGYCIGVLANDLLKTSMNRQNRIGLQEGRLLLVSPFNPETGFSKGGAMGRNRYIYTLADRALVIDSAHDSGGTWAGAVENLKHGWIPLYVRRPADGPGNEPLIAKGATPFVFRPDSQQTLAEFFSSTAAATGACADASTTKEAQLPRHPSTEPDPIEHARNTPASDKQQEGQAIATESVDSVSAKSSEGSERPAEAYVSAMQTTSDDEACGLHSADEVPPHSVGEPSWDMYLDFRTKVISVMEGNTLTEDEIAQFLGIQKKQAQLWLARACEDSLVAKQKGRPARYFIQNQSSLC
ncbi:MAG: DNA-protecting protein DprA [Proteobacteria bacterium]|nr:DNA-protecting protein DprA [Pseudomonadota bacterium]MBS0494545.1 DNA-protecting protein DprA [Pseudomonadota bacterium]